MRLELRFDSLKQTKPTEYVSRFVFGGLVTVLAGFVAAHFGPVIGGLFLAFPGIFPAGVSLVEKHKTLRERAEGKLGTWSARGQPGTAMALRPVALTSLKVSSASFCSSRFPSRKEKRTSAPSFAKQRATARPIPLSAPVMRAERPMRRSWPL
jgi:hypothetical protein